MTKTDFQNFDFSGGVSMLGDIKFLTMMGCSNKAKANLSISFHDDLLSAFILLITKAKRQNWNINFDYINICTNNVMVMSLYNQHICLNSQTSHKYDLKELVKFDLEDLWIENWIYRSEKRNIYSLYFRRHASWEITLFSS